MKEPKREQVNYTKTMIDGDMLKNLPKKDEEDPLVNNDETRSLRSEIDYSK